MAEGESVTGMLTGEMDRQWAQAKQSEDQRAALSSFIIVIGVAAQGFIVDKDFPKRAMAVAISMVILGLFGFLATAKYYERFRMSMSRVGRLREELDHLHADLKLDEIEQRADNLSARFSLAYSTYQSCLTTTSFKRSINSGEGGNRSGVGLRKSGIAGLSMGGALRKRYPKGTSSALAKS